MAPGPKKPLFGAGSRGSEPPAAKRPLRRAETRRSERQTAFKNGKIILADGSVVDCIVRNLSTDGCNVTLLTAEHLPDDITIRVDVLSKARPAKVIWRDQGVAGVKFLEPA